MAYTILKKLRLIFFLLLAVSCTVINSYISDETTHQIDTKESYHPGSCDTNTWAIIGNSENLTDNFKKFIDVLNKNNIRTTFIDRASMWLLVQAYAHPHLASPTARISYYIQDDSHAPQYSDIMGNVSSSPNFPIFFAIENLLENNKSQHSLVSLVQLIDRFFSKSILVEKSLQVFIEQNKKILRQNADFKNLFFRGKQSVKQDESLQRFSLLKVIDEYRKNYSSQTNYMVDSHLYTYHAKRLNADISCNYDLNLYKHHIYLLSAQEKQALPLAYVEGNSRMLASLSQDTTQFKSIGVGHLIGGDSTQGLRPAFCHLTNKDFSLLLLSNKDRDPAQLLYSLIEETSLSFSFENIYDALSQSRQLILLNPHRAVVESKNLNEDKLDNLVKSRIPIYHFSPIGNIQAIFKKKQNSSSLFTDSRNNNTLFCSKQNTNKE